MNPVQVHLAFNHVPIVGMAIGALLLIAGIIGKNREWIRAAFAIQVLCAVVAVPVFRSGEPTEEVVEHAPGVIHDAIEAHEEIAVLGLRLVVALGAVALFSLFKMRAGRSTATLLPFVALVLAVVTSVVLGITAHRGGLIRHPELSGAIPALTEHKTHEDSEGD